MEYTEVSPNLCKSWENIMSNIQHNLSNGIYLVEGIYLSDDIEGETKIFDVGRYNALGEGNNITSLNGGYGKVSQIFQGNVGIDVKLVNEYGENKYVRTKIFIEYENEGNEVILTEYIADWVYGVYRYMLNENKGKRFKWDGEFFREINGLDISKSNKIFVVDRKSFYRTLSDKRGYMYLHDDINTINELIHEDIMKGLNRKGITVIEDIDINKLGEVKVFDGKGLLIPVEIIYKVNINHREVILQFKRYAVADGKRETVESILRDFIDWLNKDILQDKYSGEIGIFIYYKNNIRYRKNGIKDLKELKKVVNKDNNLIIFNSKVGYEQFSYKHILYIVNQRNRYNHLDVYKEITKDFKILCKEETNFKYVDDLEVIVKCVGNKKIIIGSHYLIDVKDNQYEVIYNFFSNNDDVDNIVRKVSLYGKEVEKIVGNCLSRLGVVEKVLDERLQIFYSNNTRSCLYEGF